jgi:hypothetical protein
MGIVVCITMLIGLSVLQPTPWDSAKQLEHGPKFLLLMGSGHGSRLSLAWRCYVQVFMSIVRGMLRLAQ